MRRLTLTVLVVLIVVLGGGLARAQYYGGGGAIFPNSGPVTGMFAPGLAIDPSTNRPYVDHVLTISMPGSYQIDLATSNPGAYDPFLYLLQGGVVVATNDDGGGSLNSRIAQFLAPGTYVVRVSSFRSGPVTSVALYTLTVQGGGYNPVLPVTVPITVPTPLGAQTLLLNVPLQGMFLPGFPLTPGEGRPYVDYTFSVAFPATYQIDLRSVGSTGYDPYLYLLQNGMVIDRNDDGGGSTNSRITRFLSPGLYVVRVSSYQRGSIGPAPFALSVMTR